MKKVRRGEKKSLPEREVKSVYLASQARCIYLDNDSHRG